MDAGRRGMSVSGKRATSVVISALRYRDLNRAVDWLGAAFGFELIDWTSDEMGVFQYAELRFGWSTIIIGSLSDPQFSGLMTQPDEIGGAETQICYLVVPDAVAHYERAKAAGANIIAELTTDGGGNQNFSCRDIEGHIWTFGTYVPKGVSSFLARSTQRGHAWLWGVGAAFAATIAYAAGTYVPVPFPLSKATLPSGAAIVTPSPELAGVANGMAAVSELEGEARRLREQLAIESTTKIAAERARAQAQERYETLRKSHDTSRQELAETNSRLTTLTRDVASQEELKLEVQRTKELLASERAAREAADRATEQMKARFDAEKDALAVARRINAQTGASLTALTRDDADQKTLKQEAQRAKEQLESERTAREAADRASAQKQTQLDAERVALAAARRTIAEATARLTALTRDVANQEELKLEVQRTKEQLGSEIAAREAAEQAHSQTQDQLKTVRHLHDAARRELAAASAKLSLNARPAESSDGRNQPAESEVGAGLSSPDLNGAAPPVGRSSTAAISPLPGSRQRNATKGRDSQDIAKGRARTVPSEQRTGPSPEATESSNVVVRNCVRRDSAGALVAVRCGLAPARQ